MDRRLVSALAVLSLLLPPLVPAARALDDPKPDAPAPAAPAAPAETDDQVLERITGEMAKKVEEIRGLKFKKEVKRVWKSRDEAKAEMIAGIDRDMPREKQIAASREMAFFGFLREGTDLRELFSDFISAGAGGYYIPETKVFSLVRGFKEDASRPIVFHELIHAVEDQYYDFHASQKKFGDADMGDHSAAIQALVEGSARYYEDLFVDGEPGLRMKYFKAASEAEMSSETAGKMAEMPPVILIGMVLYPYGNGSDFLKEVLPALEAKGTKDAIGAVYAAPPLSTEQILHPQKYLSSDLPREVRLPDLEAVLGEGWARVSRGTMGEFGTGLAVSAVLLPYNLQSQIGSMMKMPAKMPKTKEERAKLAATPVVQFRGETAKSAEGWDGDRYALYGKGDRLTLAWVSAWDTPEDASEFASTWGKVVAKRYGTVKEEPVEGGNPKKTRVPPDSAELKVGDWAGARWTATRDGDTAVLVKGDRVLVVERADPEVLVKLAEALAKAEVVADKKDTVPAATVR